MNDYYGSFTVERQAIIATIIADIARNMAGLTTDPEEVDELGARLSEQMTSLTSEALIPLLVECFSTFIKDHDIEEYVRLVARSSFEVWMEDKEDQ